jgi:hypothetical protein
MIFVFHVPTKATRGRSAGMGVPGFHFPIDLFLLALDAMKHRINLSTFMINEIPTEGTTRIKTKQQQVYAQKEALATSFRRMPLKEVLRRELGTNPKAYIQETVERVERSSKRLTRKS